jgi:DOPA 4,5-dioxygenase
MFEVNLFTPAQFGAFVPWLAIWRGPLSALVHPNTVGEPGLSDAQRALRNHTEQAIWLGERLPVDGSMFRLMERKEEEEREKEPRVVPPVESGERPMLA